MAERLRSEFRIVVEGIELSQDEVKSLDTAMNEAAAEMIAGLDLTRNGGLSAVFINPRFDGIDLGDLINGGKWVILQKEQFERIGLPGGIG